MTNSEKMSKFCVFCGKKPNDKTKEHILPKWLIEMTGDPNRTGFFGLNKKFELDVKHREFSFSQFTFPACDNCNNTFSKLEGKTKSILEDILQEKEISGHNLSLLMDWLDKVRVGLWLGMMQLDKNYLDVAPKFHIENRIGQSDRILIIEKSDRKLKRLNFAGIDTPAFSLAPSAFSLSINNYCFTNISNQFLFSARIGLPYLANTYVPPDKDGVEGTFVKGTERLKRPLLRRQIAEKGIKIYQPIFRNGLVMGDTKSFYSSNYIKARAMDIDNGLGNIFVENGMKFSEYKKNDLINLRPEILQDDEDLFIRSAINISEWQNWLTDQIPSLEKLSPKQRRFVKSRFRMAKKVNNLYIEHHRKILSDYKKGKLL